MNIIGLSGYMKAGKDTVGKIIQNLTIGFDKKSIVRSLESNGCVLLLSHNGQYKWQIKKFAGALKQIASILTGIPAADFEKQEVKEGFLGNEWNKPSKLHPDIPERMTVRWLLQALGTDAIRNNLHPETLVNALMSQLKDNKNYAVTDCRFPNEAIAIKKRGGILIRINRSLPEQTGLKHASETSLDSFKFDYTIDNNGTFDGLVESVHYILKKEKLI